MTLLTRLPKAQLKQLANEIKLKMKSHWSTQFPNLPSARSREQFINKLTAPQLRTLIKAQYHELTGKDTKGLKTQEVRDEFLKHNNPRQYKAMKEEYHNTILDVLNRSAQQVRDEQARKEQAREEQAREEAPLWKDSVL